MLTACVGTPVRTPRSCGGWGTAWSSSAGTSWSSPCPRTASAWWVQGTSMGYIRYTPHNICRLAPSAFIPWKLFPSAPLTGCGGWVSQHSPKHNFQLKIDWPRVQRIAELLLRVWCRLSTAYKSTFHETFWLKNPYLLIWLFSFT